ncbi:MAG: right-handed parallel beta-helix repeat-containing protein, partial [bacterium]
MQLSSRSILAVTILAATGLASIGRTAPTKTPPVALGPKTLSGFGGQVDQFHEFFTQPSSSFGDIGGIVAPDTYWVYITGIDASGVTGLPGREIQFNLQDSEDGSTFKHLGISLSIAEPLADNKDFLRCYQADGIDGVSTHILDPNNFSVNNDTLGLRFQFTKTSSPANWKITPYFRINGGAWTIFTDGQFTATQSFDFLGAKLRVGFVDGADGFIHFDNFFVVGPIRPPILTTYVDDDWLGSAFGDIVQFPGQVNVQIFGVTAFDSIQTGIDSLKTLGALGTVKVAPGNYVESVFVDSLVHIIGSGSGDNPSVDTIVRAKFTSTSTFTIDGPAASGTSPSVRFMMSDMRILDAGGISFATGSGILVSATDTTKYMTFDNIAAINNHCGIAFGEATPGPGPASLQIQAVPQAIAFFDMQILNSTFDNNTDAGILISSNIQEFDSLKVSNCDITNNSYYGITGGQSGAMAVTNVDIDNTTFSGNGVGMQITSAVASKSGLETNLRSQGSPIMQTGDVHFVDFTGDASFTNVTVTGNDEPYGIQIRGSTGGGYGISLNAKTNAVSPTVPAGIVTFTNVTVNGSFDEVPLDFGAGILIA